MQQILIKVRFGDYKEPQLSPADICQTGISTSRIVIRSTGYWGIEAICCSQANAGWIKIGDPEARAEGCAFAMAPLSFPLQLLLLLLLPQTSRMTPSTCATSDQLQMQYQYYQSGDLVVGGITSQLFSLADAVSFKEHPKTKLVQEVV